MQYRLRSYGEKEAPVSELLISSKRRDKQRLREE